MGIPSVPVTLPNIPSFPSIFAQPSNFSSGQQSTLQSFANAVSSVNTSVLTSGSQDLFNAEQFLMSNNTNLTNLLNSIYTTVPLLTGSQIPTIITAFNQGGLLNNSTTSVTALFPLSNGDTFAQFIQSLLTFAQQPGNVISNLITGNTTAAGNVANSNWYTLSNVVGGPTGTQAQAFMRPFVNTLFNVNPTTNPGAYDILYALSSNFPSSFEALFTTLFNTGPIYNGVTAQNIVAALQFGPGDPRFPNSLGGNFAQVFANLFSKSSAGNSTPYQLIFDMFQNAGNVPGDILAIINPSFLGWLEGFFPTIGSGLPNGGTNFQAVLKNAISNPAQVPLSIFNMANLGAFSVNVPANTLFGSWIQGLLQNIFTIPNPANLFVGNHPNQNFIGLGQSVQFGTIPNGTSGGGSAPGWGFSIAPTYNGISTGSWGINGLFQGDLGCALALGVAAAGAGQQGIQKIQSAFSNFFSGTSLGIAGTDLFDAAYFSGSALIILVTLMSQMMSTIMNIQNALNNQGIPTGPTTNGSNFPISQLPQLL
jgi:hypothetical protein